jgi:hypothetical protein
VAAGRATWVWDEPAPAEIAAWCGRRSVIELFVAVPTGLAGSPRLRWLRELCAALPPTVRTQLLGGDPHWVDEPDEARRWWAAATRAGGAGAVHLDLEPWAHPGWDDDRRPELVRTYLALLEELAGHGVRLEVDLAHHLHGVRTAAGERLDEAVLRVVDAITLLAYRRRVHGPDGILDLAGPTLEAAFAARRPVRLAVECRYLGGDPQQAKQTFFGRPEPELVAVLEELERLFAARPAWQGTAVHDRAGWTALPR